MCVSVYYKSASVCVCVPPIIRKKKLYASKFKNLINVFPFEV